MLTPFDKAEHHLMDICFLMQTALDAETRYNSLNKLCEENSHNIGMTNLIEITMFLKEIDDKKLQIETDLQSFIESETFSIERLYHNLSTYLDSLHDVDNAISNIVQPNSGYMDGYDDLPEY